MKLIIYVLVFFIITSCVNKKDTINKVFTKKEIQTIDKIINFYDSFVYSKSNIEFTIGKAYLTFLNKTCPLVDENGGDISPLIPERTNKIILYNSLDRNVLSDIFDIRDSINAYNRKTKEYIKIYMPYTFSINYQGKYIEFLKKLSKRNPFFEEYYQLVTNISHFKTTQFI